MPARAVAVQVGSRWAAVIDYGQHGGIGRQGCWCEDAAGGWGISRADERRAVEECVRPVLYRSRRAAQEAIDPLAEMQRDVVEAAPSPAALLGRKGGSAGRGESKSRGDSEHYRQLAAQRKRAGRLPSK